MDTLIIVTILFLWFAVFPFLMTVVFVRAWKGN